MIEKIQNTDGISLLPLVENKEIEKLLAYIESYHKNDSSQYLYGLRTPEYKYCREMENLDSACLFDLKEDPFEENNILQKNVGIGKKMEKILQNLMDSNTKKDHDSDGDEMVRNELKN